MIDVIGRYETGEYREYEHSEFGNRAGLESEETESPYFREIKNEAERAFTNACETYLREFGSHMPDSTKERLESATPEKHMNVYTEMEYNSRYPGANMGEIGRAVDNQTIEIKALSENQVRHTTFHELGHVSSFYNRRIEQAEDTPETTVESIQTGIKTKSYMRSPDGEVIVCEIKIRNAAFNEGLTEYFAREAMDNNGLEKDAIPTGYQDALDCVTQLCDLVGSETLESSYFGGDNSLKEAVNVLGESEDTFDRLSYNLDLAIYSRNVETRAQAKMEINSCIAEMSVKAAKMRKQTEEAEKV